jgi:hypothetical protein
MTTLEFMEKELKKCELNLIQQIARDAPTDHISNIKDKIGHYEKVCELLRREGE